MSSNVASYYIACSVSGKDEPNPVLWLASRAGNMALSYPLWIMRCVTQENKSSSSL